MLSTSELLFFNAGEKLSGNARVERGRVLTLCAPTQGDSRSPQTREATIYLLTFFFKHRFALRVILWNNTYRRIWLDFQEIGS